MADHETQNGHAELSRIESLVRRTRQVLRSAWVLTGAGLTLGLCLATLIITSVADLAVPMPELLRLMALILVVVPTGLAFIAGVVRPLVRRLSGNQVARRIEKHVPQIQSRLVTSLDLARDESQRQFSPVFFDRLVTETAQRVGNFRPTTVVDKTNVRRAAIFALVSVVVFGLVFGVFHDRLPTALARIFAPFADIPPATGVVFRAEPGDAKMLKDEDLLIAAVVERGEPREMTLEFRSLGGKWTTQPMVRTAPDRFEFVVREIDASIEYRLVGGRTWTRRHRVDVLERPTIAGLHTVVRYPEYMQLPEPKIGPPQTGDAAGPVGSDVEVVVDVAGDVSTGELQILTPVTKMRPVADRRERVWFEGTIPQGARAEGNWQWDFGLKFRAAHTEPPAAGQHGHGFQGAPTGFEIQPGDVLFTYAQIVPGQLPEEIMLQFHDGTNWEHRVFWGADKIVIGTPDSASRHRAGDLPAAGDFVRLEVPAKAVGLEGKKVFGIQFTLFGGQCKWNRVGVIDPAEVAERTFVVESRFPMGRRASTGEPEPSASSDSPSDSTSQGSNASTLAWSGHVPLTRDMVYRVELKNELGHANKDMKEFKLTALPDNPPQVTIDRPGSDMVLTAPQRVPLLVQAYDDYGLADVSLAVQKGDSGGFVGAPLKTITGPVRHESIVSALDLEPYQLKAGEHVRYRVQARDRKDQLAQSQEFVIRIAADANAADKQLASLETQDDSFQQKLLQLIAQQSKVTAAVAKMAGREHEPVPSGKLEDAIKQAAHEQQPAPSAATKNDPTAKNTADARQSNDPATAAEMQKKMAELRQELAKLAPQQETNVQLGQQVQTELNQAAVQAAASKLLPQPVAEQMRAAEQAFQDAALQPMRDALAAMKQAADANQPNPDIEKLADMTEQIQQQLEAMHDRLQALERARQNMKNDPAEALAKLRDDLNAMNAEMSAQDLAALQDFLDRLMGQMKMLEGRENELARLTEDAKPITLPDIDKEQAKAEAEAEKLLAQAERMKEADDLLKRRRMPEFPDAPFTPDGEEMMVPPEEEDTFEPDAEMKGDAKDDAKADGKAEKKDAEEEEEEMFMPPTGVRQKMDPRFAKKVRPVRKKKDAAGKTAPASPEEMLRDMLLQREQQTAAQLNEAQRELQPQRDQLGQLLEQIRQALSDPSAPESARELAELMESMDMQQAMALAQAMRQAQSQSQQPSQQANNQPPQPSPHTPALAQTLTQPNAGLRLGVPGELNDLDLAAATVILRMQPRLREELLKGMREEGPEAYRKFIQDYFNRLTKVKAPQP
jgi:hypothetical protein